MTVMQMIHSFMDQGATADEAIASAALELRRKQKEAVEGAMSQADQDYVSECFWDEFDELRRIAAHQDAAHMETENCPEWAR